MPINWRKKRQLRWTANRSVGAFVLHTLLVGAVASVVASERNMNNDIVLLWAVPALLDFPSSLLAIMSSIFPRTVGLGASPYMLHTWVPAFSFGFFGGIQWLLVVLLLDKRRIDVRTKKAASLTLVGGLLLIPFPLAVGYFLDSLYTHGLGDRALGLIVPTLCAWMLAAALILRGIYGFFAFPGKREERACGKCGYCLKGLTEPRCPECGTEFEPELLLGLGKDLSA